MKLIEQLSDFQAWASTGPTASKIDLLDYVGFIATPDMLFAFGELFRPTLLLHDNNYFIASRFSEEAFKLWKEKLQDASEIQKVINHVHISTLLQQQTISDELAAESATLIATIWSSVFQDKGLVGLAFGETFGDAAVTLLRKT